METNVSRLGQGPGLAWKRTTSSFPPGSLAELQEWTGKPEWHGELTFQQWNTIGWAITDDGTLCIKPWKGDTGETGTSTSSDDVPWNVVSSDIRNVESTGTIALSAECDWLFYGCSSLTDLTGLADWDVSNVKDMSYMFYGCSKLTNLTGLEDWDVSNVKSMNRMLQFCSSLTDLTALEHWTVSNVTDMRVMFANCSSLTDLTALEHWDVSNVTDMSVMFFVCESLTDLTALASWNVSNVTSMGNVFYGCSRLQKIGIPSIANGGQNLVKNAKNAKLTTVLPRIASEDGSMGPYTWDELKSAMTNRPSAFRSGTVWVKAEEAAQ